MHVWVIVVAVALAFEAQLAAAQPLNEQPPDAKVKPAVAEPETIVVTATRSDQPAHETMRSVDVVSAMDIEEKQARSAPEALKEAPGVFVQETNRGSGSPIIRGLIGPQNLLLLDGLRFNTSISRTGPNQYLAMMPTFAASRIEVVRGPSSALYGNGAMGGVVNLMSARPDRYASRKVEGSLWAHSADLALGGRARFSESHGPVAITFGVSATDRAQLRDGEGQRQPLSDYGTASWYLRGLLMVDPSWDLQTLYSGTIIRNAGRTDRLGQGDARLYDNDDHFAYMKGVWRPSAAISEVSAAVVFHRTHEKVDRFNCATDMDNIVLNLDGCETLSEPDLTRKRKYNDIVNVIGFDVGSEIRFLEERIRVRFGGEGYFEFIDSSLLDARSDDGFVWAPKERGNFSDGSSYATLGAFSRLDATVLRLRDGKDRIVAAGGARLSNFRARAPDVPSLGDVNYSFSGAAGSVGLQYLYQDSFNLYASFVQGFRAPNLQETTVLADTGSKFEIPNPDLGPERSDTVEVGAKVYTSKLKVAAAVFWTGLRDAINEESADFNGMTDVDGKPVIRRVNAASGEYVGVEGSAQYRVGPITGSVSVAWTRGDVTNAMNETTPARRIPPLFGTGRVRYDSPKGKVFAEGFVQWAGRQDRLHPSDKKDLRICESSKHSGELIANCNGTDGWATLNLRGGLELGTNWNAYLAVLNLTDASYHLHGSGFEAAGIDVRATVSAQW